MLIPSYGIGYLLNSLSRRWWLSLPLYTLAALWLIASSSGKITAMEWFAIASAYVGGALSNLTMRLLKRGNYRQFVVPKKR